MLDKRVVDSGETAVADEPRGYIGLLARPAMGPLFATMFVVRLTNQMWGLVVVLLALTRFHSPALAGLFAAANIAPGIVLGPAVGALLDRYGRRPLILLDLSLGCLVALAIATLDHTGALSPAALAPLVI